MNRSYAELASVSQLSSQPVLHKGLQEIGACRSDVFCKLNAVSRAHLTLQALRVVDVDS